MGLSLFEFWHSTPREFDNRLKGFIDARLEQDKLSWTQTRLIAFYNVAPHSKKIKKPTDLFPFDWEKKGIKHLGYVKEDRVEIEKMAKDIWKIKADGTTSRADHTTGDIVTPDKLNKVIHGL